MTIEMRKRLDKEFAIVDEIFQRYGLSDSVDVSYIMHDIQKFMTGLVKMREINPADENSDDFMGITEEDAKAFAEVASLCQRAKEILDERRDAFYK